MKTLTEIIKNIDDKLKHTINNDEDKKKMDGIFEKKGIGRPTGDFETKRKQYCGMLNNKRIKQPKQQTLEYYKLDFDRESGAYS